MAIRRARARRDLAPDEMKVVGMPGDLVSEAAVAARPRSSSVMVSLRVDRPTFDELSRIAETRGKTFSETAREAIRAYVDSLGQDRSYRLLEAIAEQVGLKVHEVDRAYHSTPGSKRSPLTAWTDRELEQALDRYEAACRAADMRDSAWRSYLDYARRFLAWRTGDYRPRGAARSGRPIPAAPATTVDLGHQATAYARDVEAAGRAVPTVDTYYRHAMFFVRWLDGDFEPGARLTRLR
jgi:hypothetical protein